MVSPSAKRLGVSQSSDALERHKNKDTKKRVWFRFAFAGRRSEEKLFHLFDDEHFDGHICGNEFEAELIGQSLFQFIQVRIVGKLVSNFFDVHIPFEVENIMVGESCFIDYGTS